MYSSEQKYSNPLPGFFEGWEVFILLYATSSEGQNFYTGLRYHKFCFLVEIWAGDQFGLLVLLALRTQIVTTILLQHVKLVPVYAKVVFKKNSQAASSDAKCQK